MSVFCVSSLKRAKCIKKTCKWKEEYAAVGKVVDTLKHSQLNKRPFVVVWQLRSQKTHSIMKLNKPKFW